MGNIKRMIKCECTLRLRSKEGDIVDTSAIIYEIEVVTTLFVIFYVEETGRKR